MANETGMEILERKEVIGAPISILTWDQIVSQVSCWAKDKKSKYICICNVHSVVSAYREAGFLKVISNADIATPDGAPVAWLMRKLGVKGQERINGPDLMWLYCAEAEKTGESIFLYGGKESTLEALEMKLIENFPKLNIAGYYSPPFRALTQKEDEEIIKKINKSGAGTVWVSLGCPKQEFWMAEHRGRVKAVMIGVGAAFDYHAGTLKRAPLWMQRNGLEWFYRLMNEPRRLWKRYLVTNALFVVYSAKQLIKY